MSMVKWMCLFWHLQGLFLLLLLVVHCGLCRIWIISWCIKGIFIGIIKRSFHIGAWYMDYIALTRAFGITSLGTFIQKVRYSIESPLWREYRRPTFFSGGSRFGESLAVSCRGPVLFLGRALCSSSKMSKYFESCRIVLGIRRSGRFAKSPNPG